MKITDIFNIMVSENFQNKMTEKEKRLLQTYLQKEQKIMTTDYACKTRKCKKYRDARKNAQSKWAPLAERLCGSHMTHKRVDCWNECRDDIKKEHPEFRRWYKSYKKYLSKTLTCFKTAKKCRRKTIAEMKKSAQKIRTLYQQILQRLSN